MLRHGPSCRSGGNDPKRLRDDDPGVACGSSAADGRVSAPAAPDDPPSFSEYLAGKLERCISMVGRYEANTMPRERFASSSSQHNICSQRRDCEVNVRHVPIHSLC